MHGMILILLLVIVGAGAWMLGSKSSESRKRESEDGSEGKVEVVREESPEEKKSAAVPAAFWVALGGVIGALAAMLLFSKPHGPGIFDGCLGLGPMGPHVFSPGIFIIIAVIIFAVIVLLKKR